MDKFIISGIGIIGMVLCGEVFAASPNTIFHTSDWNEQKNIIETLNAKSMVFDDTAKEIRFAGNSFFRFTDTGDVFINGKINTNTIISSSFALTPFTNLSQLPANQSTGTIALVQDVGMVYWSGNNWIAQNPKSTIVSYQDTVGTEQGLFEAFTTSDDFTPTLMGSINTPLETGSEIHVFENNTLLGKASVNNLNWSITLATQSEGMHQYSTKIVKSNGEKIDGTNTFNVLLYTPSMANSAGKLVSATSLGTASLGSIQASAQNISKIPSNFVAKYAVSSNIIPPIKMEISF